MAASLIRLIGLNFQFSRIFLKILQNSMISTVHQDKTTICLPDQLSFCKLPLLALLRIVFACLEVGLLFLNARPFLSNITLSGLTNTPRLAPQEKYLVPLTDPSFLPEKQAEIN